MTILVLGGSGLAGGHIASALLENPDLSIVLGARDESRLATAAAKLVARHGADRLTTAVVDAADADSLKRAATGVDVIAVAAHTKQHEPAIARAAFDAGADVVDIGMSTAADAEADRLDSEAETSGRCLVTDAGAYPGLPSFLIRLAGGRMDRLDTAFVGATASNPDGWPPETVEEMVGDIAHPPTIVWRQGEWRRCRLLGMSDRKKFDFGDAWGTRTCTPFFVEELRHLPQVFPSLREAGSFTSLNRMTDSVALPLAMVAMRVAPRRGLRPASRLVGWALKHYARPPIGAIFKVEATGQRDGQPAELAATLSHRNEYEATGQVVAAYISQWLDGKDAPARTRGRHPMGMVVDPEPFLRDLLARGFVSSETGAPRSQ